MKQTTITLVDDLDGSVAEETHTLSLDGVEVELDLSSKNAAKLTSVLQPYMKAGRRAPGSRRRRTTTHKSNGEDLHAIREWALKNGQPVAARGRISGSVVEAYKSSLSPEFSAQ